MLLIQGDRIKKYFGDRLIVEIENIKIYSEDRIGIVGVNGAGKTTLLNILSQRIKPDEGDVKAFGKVGYISQVSQPDCFEISNEMASKFNIAAIWNETMSGGEKTKFKIAHALDGDNLIILADEPTSNVDMAGIEFMEEELTKYKGALILISHDRRFLDRLCNQILEIEFGKVQLYKGNYSDYMEQKRHGNQRAKFEYDEYMKEKKRLEGVIKGTKEKVSSMKRPPKRMGNSEARLHKMGGQKAKSNLERGVKNIEKRIQHLDSKEKPKEIPHIKFDIMDTDKLNSKQIIKGKNISKVFGDKVILKNASFEIYNGSKIALIGPNGCGKSTLIKMIVEKDEAITIAKGAKIGYFSQDMSILNDKQSIIDNVMQNSIYPESFVRLILARLLFKGEDVSKNVHVLSGGERVKVSFAKILLGDINLMILDEPTNYMDINSLEVIEEALKEYDRTLLFVSHDRSLVETVANQIMTIENSKIKIFNGTYTEYVAKKNKVYDKNMDEMIKKEILLQNRLSEVISKLSMPSINDDMDSLDKQYHKILAELKDLKEK